MRTISSSSWSLAARSTSPTTSPRRPYAFTSTGTTMRPRAPRCRRVMEPSSRSNSIPAWSPPTSAAAPTSHGAPSTWCPCPPSPATPSRSPSHAIPFRTACIPSSPRTPSSCSSARPMAATTCLMQAAPSATPSMPRRWPRWCPSQCPRRWPPMSASLRGTCWPTASPMRPCKASTSACSRPCRRTSSASANALAARRRRSKRGWTAGCPLVEAAGTPRRTIMTW